MELAKAKASVARLAALIHTPAFDGIDPAAHERLVSPGDEVKERPAHDVRRRQEAVIGTIVDRAVLREPVEDEGGAYGLLREGFERYNTVWAGPAPASWGLAGRIFICVRR